MSDDNYDCEFSEVGHCGCPACCLCGIPRDAQDRHPQGGAGEARPLNVEGSAGEPNPSVDDIPADVEARIKARVMAEIRQPGSVRIDGKDYPNSYTEPGQVVEIDYGAMDCPGCGGDGQVYSQNKPYPDGPCRKCGGTGTVYR